MRNDIKTAFRDPNADKLKLLVSVVLWFDCIHMFVQVSSLSETFVDSSEIQGEDKHSGLFFSVTIPHETTSKTSRF